MYYERKLPHWQPEGAEFFVTWRLHGSVPRTKLKPSEGPVWLKIPEVAADVSRAILQGEREWELYDLRAWVVMPNHVHVLLSPRCPLSKALMNLKSATARRANQILGRTGHPFWQVESYDRWVRSDDEGSRIVRYIEANPVRAGLVAAVELWPWSSASAAAGRGSELLQTGHGPVLLGYAD